MDVIRVAPTIFRVTSDTAHDKTYTVDESIPNCTCTDWATKRNKLVSQSRAAGRDGTEVRYECKHVRAARLHLNDPIDSGDPTTAAARKQKEAIQAKFKKKSAGEGLSALIADLEGE